MKKLSLNRETVRTLTGSELEAIHGGMVVLIDDGTRSDTGGSGIPDSAPSYCLANPCNSGAWTDCATCGYGITGC
jgi:hypothetical protein